MLKTWFIALRPWSFTASIIPISLGAILAWNQGYFQPFLYFLTLVGGVSMHAGTNLINTYGDFISGVDTEESAPTCPQLVKNILEPKKMQLVGIVFFVFTAMLGIYLVMVRGGLLLLVGILGILSGYGYTDGIAYKYRGLGVILVFFLMGPLMVWGAYFVQTGIHSWLPVWVSFPLGFLVSAILHSNDLRDIEFDRKAGIKTLAILLGKDLSIYLYCFLNIAAILSLIILVVSNLLPTIALLPLIFVPDFQKIIANTCKASQGDLQKMAGLEADAAQLHFKFGSLLAVALLINLLF